MTLHDTHLLALWLMAAQGALGAFDTLLHHEGTEALPRTPGAARELRIHALRSSLYAPLFIGLSCWAWHGAWAWVLLAVFGVEIVLTLWDFVVEDRTRLLPATERITHTVLAINAGAFIALLALTARGWAAQPTALAWQPHGLLSAWLALCGVGVGLSALRDGWAAHRLARRARHAAPGRVHFGTQPQHVLVTGGTGFVGQTLVRQLLADGHAVTVLTRRPKAAAWQFDGAVRCVANLQDIPAATPVQVVINLAGARILGWRWTARRRATLLQSRAGLTQRLVAWMAAQPPARRPWLLLSGSAIGYYGVQPLGDATSLDESAPPQPLFMSALCQRWEAAAAQAAPLGVQVALLRLGFVLGQQGSLPLMLLPVQLGLGGPLGDGRQWLSWVHVQDVVRAIAHVWTQAEKPPSAAAPTNVQAWNLTAPEPLSQTDFTRCAAQVLRRPFWLPTPAAPVRALLGEQVDLLLQGQRVLPERLLASGFAFAYPNARAALLDLCR
ncbi:TIGR01777 family protein [Comamonadaceae bacterium OH2545_COT-014]|nr:TIGR01777 family protein [Comamonadaceae bacterium OH2545_COT-014]